MVSFVSDYWKICLRHEARAYISRMNESLLQLLILCNLNSIDANEIEIAQKGGLAPIIAAARSGDLELESQCARALRNLSVNEGNKKVIRDLGGVEVLLSMTTAASERVRQQSTRALANLGITVAPPATT